MMEFGLGRHFSSYRGEGHGPEILIKRLPEVDEENELLMWVLEWRVILPQNGGGGENDDQGLFSTRRFGK